MNMCKGTIIMAAGAAVAAQAVADPASASTATQSVRSFIFPVKATTTVRTKAFGNGGVWATVTVQRTATVSGGVPVLPSHCGPGAIRCFGYSAVVKDAGSFRAYRFALTPNQFIPGRHIRSVVTGRMVLLVRVLRRGQLAEAVLPATSPWTGTSSVASGAKTAVTCQPMGLYHGLMGFT